MSADVQLASAFTHHMVLHCDMPGPVWGWADVAAGNRFNPAGLPASPFRNDTQP